MNKTEEYIMEEYRKARVVIADVIRRDCFGRVSLVESLELADKILLLPNICIKNENNTSVSGS